MLCKARWDIEKVFDEFKSKLVETKAWASSPNAKTVQARLLCLTHTTVSNDWIAAKLAMGHPGSVSRVVSAGRVD